MKFSCSASTKPFALLLAAAAATIPARAPVLEDPDRGGWFARLGAVARFNIKATMDARNPVLPAGHFDNGFVLPDVGGSPDLTWNWGYNNASQVGTDTINFHRYD